MSVGSIEVQCTNKVVWLRSVTTIVVAWAILEILTIANGQAQTPQLITLKNEVVTAGDNLQGELYFDNALPCPGTMQLQMVHGNSVGFSLFFDVGKGISTVAFNAAIPGDLKTDRYDAAEIKLLCTGYQAPVMLGRPLPVNLKVNRVATPLKFPVGTALQLTATKKQFLDTKIAELNSLDAELVTWVEAHGADVNDLRSHLISVANDAEKALNVTESQYQKQVLGRGNRAPAFFADLRAQYDGLQTDLRAPPPGTKASVESTPSVIYVVQRLKTRKSDEQTQRGVSATYPPDVVATRAVLANNRGAYEYIRDTDRLTFVARLVSEPTHARVKYRKLIDRDFTDYAGTTEVPSMELDLATWIFVFHSDHCPKDQSVRISPYTDRRPVVEVEVEFPRCGRP